jgi:hypothetical protein
LEKGEGIYGKGFGNGRLERRPSLVNLRRLEPPREENIWGKKGSGKVESPDEFQNELIKEGGKGMFLGWSRQVS